MFNIIKAGITAQEACETFINDYMVLLVDEDIEKDTPGDLIFVGSIADRRKFVSKHEPPEGYLFYMIRGDNLREYCPIKIEGLPCYSK